MEILALIQYIPELLGLIKAIQNRIDEAKSDRKITDDLKSIKAAFDAKDPNLLNHIFNTELSDKTDKL